MYVITGATGHSGKTVATALLAKGQRVRAIGRNADRLRELANLGAEPFVCDLTDTDALTRAFAGARGVYAMIPPNPASDDYRGHQDRIADSISTALDKALVSHSVTLSSIGADKPSGTGPVVGLYRFEHLLNGIGGLNVLHLRPGYFMENTLPQSEIIKSMGVTAGPLNPQLKLTMIATRDIGAAAADALSKLDFSGSQTRELLGQRDLTMTEAASIIGKGIGVPGLGYVQVRDEQFREALIQMGYSSNSAALMVEMVGALNSGHMKALEQRSATNTTATSFETFVEEEFVPLYKGKAAGA
jgi:uncharacterized protein YbjT (DUF2867 family)